MKFIQKTPCTRDSLMYGIVGGLTFAGLYFLKTSKFSFTFLLFMNKITQGISYLGPCQIYFE